MCSLPADDAQPKMRFSLSPPPPKVSLTSPTSTANSTTGSTNSTGTINNNHSSGRGNGELGRVHTSHNNNNNMLSSTDDADDAASDYNQWLHAMKLVARLPGGTPPEFRRKVSESKRVDSNPPSLPWPTALAIVGGQVSQVEERGLDTAAREMLLRGVARG